MRGQYQGLGCTQLLHLGKGLKSSLPELSIITQLLFGGDSMKRLISSGGCKECKAKIDQIKWFSERTKMLYGMLEIVVPRAKFLKKDELVKELEKIKDDHAL